MGFISATASKVAAGGSGQGAYMTVSKLGDGEHHRVAIVSPTPLEYWTVWGENEEGKKKPFRFASEPSQSDINAEFGEDWTQRQNYEQTGLEAPKFGLSFFVFDYADSKIKVFEITQKTLIKELDRLSQDEDYADIHAWDLKFSRTGLKMATEYKILPSPRKPDSQAKIDEAWSAADSSGYDITQLLVGGSPFGEG